MMQDYRRDAVALVPEGLRDFPPAWLALLERARADDDYNLASVADAELRRLGVQVHYTGTRADQPSETLSQEVANAS